MVINTNNWDAERYRHGSYLQEQQTERFLLDYQFPSNAIILDIGCGDGRITCKLAELFPEGYVTGIDRSKEEEILNNTNKLILIN